MLDQGRLLGNLRKFCDADHASFEGSPVTRDEARHKWATAFADYFDQVQEAPAPTPGHTSMLHAGVDPAFYGDLGLDTTISAAAAAADFAGAWQQGVLAVTPGGTLVVGPTSYIFISFTNVAPLKTALETTLTTLFLVPSPDATVRLTAIAQAFNRPVAAWVAKNQPRTGSLTDRFSHRACDRTRASMYELVEQGPHAGVAGDPRARICERVRAWLAATRPPPPIAAPITAALDRLARLDPDGRVGTMMTSDLPD